MAILSNYRGAFPNEEFVLERSLVPNDSGYMIEEFVLEGSLVPNDSHYMHSFTWTVRFQVQLFSVLNPKRDLSGEKKIKTTYWLTYAANSDQQHDKFGFIHIDSKKSSHHYKERHFNTILWLHYGWLILLNLLSTSNWQKLSSNKNFGWERPSDQFL